MEAHAGVISTLAPPVGESVLVFGVAKESPAPVTFLLRSRSSGINARRIVLDAGMEVNYFDCELVERAMR
jgi:hypothetical protein